EGERGGVSICPGEAGGGNKANGGSRGASEAGFIASVIGLDETVSQTVPARHWYDREHIVWGARFADVISRLPDGRRRIDLARFHDVIPDETCLPPWLTRGGSAA